jgi:copper chaperone CopZ
VAVERVEGVQEASFSYELAEGFVTYDPSMTSPEQILAELARMTDYRGTVRDGEGSDDGSTEPMAEGEMEHNEAEHDEADGNEASGGN